MFSGSQSPFLGFLFGTLARQSNRPVQPNERFQNRCSGFVVFFLGFLYRKFAVALFRYEVAIGHKLHGRYQFQ